MSKPHDLTTVTLCGLVALAACKGGEEPDSRPVVPVVRFSFSQDTTTQPDRVANETIDVAGVTGTTTVDVPLEKLPKNLEGLKVMLSFPTPCGRKQLSVALPKNDRAPAAEPYKPEQVHDPKFGYFYAATLPFDSKYPMPTHVYLDPDLNGALAIGELSGTVTKGVPDEKLGLTKPATSGFLVQELDCGAKVTVAGRTETIPVGRGAVFITADTARCFLDEQVGYGDSGSGGKNLSGSSVYRLLASSYDFYFVKADQRAGTSATATGATRSRFGRCE